MIEKKRFRKLWSILLAALLVLPGGALAQSPDGAPSKAFSKEQLEQLLAPVALYPDSLLTQILMASTYPLEVVKANNWVKQNKELKGDALTAALEKQEWDPSVKSLVNFPQVLQMMSDKVDWTQQLGDAFLAQQKDVMATVQTLRAKALTAGNLKTTKEQTVLVCRNRSNRRSSSSSRPARRSSTCRRTTPRWFTASGRTPPTRRIPSTRPDMPRVRFLPGLACRRSVGLRMGEFQLAGET